MTLPTLASCLDTGNDGVPDPGSPYLFTDLYPWDLDDPRTAQIDDPPWDKAFANTHLIGAILKAWDGGAYGQAYSEWFIRNFKALVKLYGDARGVTRFVGGYLFIQFLRTPAVQAEAYLRTMEVAGWNQADIVPIIDVEDGGERAPNRRASNQQIVDCVTEIATWLRSRTGRGIMLYGRGLMRDRSIASKMGCDRVWNPSYTETMVTNGLCGRLPDGKAAPWTLSDIRLWQYGGDGDGNNHITHLPLELVGFGKVDLSVYIAGTVRPTMEIVRRGLL